MVVVRQRLNMKVVQLFLRRVDRMLRHFLLAIILRRPITRRNFVLRVREVLFCGQLRFIVNDLLIVRRLVSARLNRYGLLTLAFFNLRATSNVRRRLRILLLLVRLRRRTRRVHVTIVLNVSDLMNVSNVLMFSLTSVMLNRSLYGGRILEVLLCHLLRSRGARQVLLRLNRVRERVVVYHYQIEVSIPNIFMRVRNNEVVTDDVLADHLNRRMVVSLAVI